MIEITGRAKIEEVRDIKFNEVAEVPSELDAKVYNIGESKVSIGYKLESGIPVIYDVTIFGEKSSISPLLSLLFRAKIPYRVILKELRKGDFEDIADVIQQFLSEFGIMEPPKNVIGKQESILTFAIEEKKKEVELEGKNLAICPMCGKKTLVIEDGCYTCINPECGWSKCEV